MNFFNFFKSKAYKKGFKSGSNNESQLVNPYSDEATQDNWAHGMGTSPWWDTNYKPFIDWNLGWSDGRQPIVDKHLDKLLG